MHEHYFDDIDLKDSRLLRSSVLHMKVEQYLNTYVPKIPDSVSAAIDRIIERARGNNEVFQYLVVTLLNQYASSDIWVWTLFSYTWLTSTINQEMLLAG